MIEPEIPTPPDTGAAGRRRDVEPAAGPSLALGLPPPRELLVMRALPGVGDFLCITPALRALRAGWPRTRITVLGLTSARPIVARFPHLVDRWLGFPGFPGLPEMQTDIRGLLDFLGAVQGRFDLALQMHGSGLYSNIFVQLLGAHNTAGFYAPPLPCPDVTTYLPYHDDVPEPRRYLALVAHLGLTPSGEQLEFPLDHTDELACDGLLRQIGVADGAAFAVIHPGATVPQRRVDPAVLAQVADGLVERGLSVLVTGNHDEGPIVAAVIGRAARRPVDLRGRTSLGTLGALIRRARLLVAGDTGVSHLASAVRTPSVVVFLASPLERWAPLDRVRHRVVDGRSAAPTAAAILAEADAALAAREVACA
jgi:ADP-heptose:LPS heptosyltransferase